MQNFKELMSVIEQNMAAVANCYAVKNKMSEAVAIHEAFLGLQKALTEYAKEKA